MWFTGAGAVAGILTLSFSGAVSFSNVVVNYFFSGLFFAVLVTATTAAQDSFSKWDYKTIVRYCSAALVLVLGVPCGLLVAAAVDRLLSTVAASGESANVVLSFYLPASVAIALWALCLTAFLKIVVLRWRTTWFLQAIVLAFTVFAVVAGADALTKSLWQKSLFVPLFIIGDQVGSAVFLALATQQRDPIQELVDG
jgi:hypothetical protein